MKYIYLGLLLSFSSLLFTSCDDGDFVFGKHTNGTGSIITKSRTFGKFEEIEVANNSDVEIYKGNEQTVEVSDYENIIKYTQASVEGGRLIIKNEPENINISNSRSKVVIHTPNAIRVLHISGSGNIILKDAFNDISKVSISGSGDIQAEQPCALHSINASISGSGDIVFIGTASEATLHISGSGDLKFSGLKANSVNCSISGSGDISTFAINNLEAHISGSGDIEYFGHPTVNSSVSGSGEVKHGE